MNWNSSEAMSPGRTETWRRLFLCGDLPPTGNLPLPVAPARITKMLLHAKKTASTVQICSWPRGVIGLSRTRYFRCLFKSRSNHGRAREDAKRGLEELFSTCVWNCEFSAFSLRYPHLLPSISPKRIINIGGNWFCMIRWNATQEQFSQWMVYCGSADDNNVGQSYLWRLMACFFPCTTKPVIHSFCFVPRIIATATIFNFRAQQLCESRGGRPGLPVPNSPYDLCGRKATLNLNSYKQNSGAVWKSRWTSWAARP